MRITRQRRDRRSQAPEVLPSADLRLDDDFFDLPLTTDSGSPDAESTEEALVVYAPRVPPKRRTGLWLVVVLLAVAASGAAGYYLNLSPPRAEVSTPLLDFGEVRLDTPAGELAVELGNQGEKVLAVESALLAGDAVEDFRVTDDGCSGRQVAPRQACTVRLAFTPRALGARQARLDVITNAVNPLVTLPLLGQGVAPELRAAPSRLDFGEALLGTAGATVGLKLSNDGTSPLSLAEIRLAGLAAADFIRQSDGCGGEELAPGEDCSVSYRFVPTAEGLRRARVEIDSDAQPLESPPWLVGVGLPLEPLLRLEPERLDFGGWLVGSASPGQVVTVLNEGDGPLEIKRWVASVAEVTAAGGATSTAPPRPKKRLSAENDLPPRLDALGAGFELAEDGCSGRTVEPGGSCSVEIRFRPAREGSAHGFFEIEHSARGGSSALAVQGLGTAPRAAVDTARVSFGEMALATRTSPRVVRLTNTGTGPLEVGAVAVDGPDRQAFSPPASRCAGATLAAGASCVVEIRFRPRRDGPHRAELVLRHTAGRGVHRIPLVGLGVSGRLVAEPARLDMGRVRRSVEDAAPLVLRNRGRAAVAIQRLTLSGAYASAFELRLDTCSGSALAPGESCRVGLRFAPDRPGTHNAVLRIDHGSAGVREVPVTATAVAPPPPSVP